MSVLQTLGNIVFGPTSNPGLQGFAGLQSHLQPTTLRNPVHYDIIEHAREAQVEAMRGRQGSDASDAALLALIQSRPEKLRLERLAERRHARRLRRWKRAYGG